MVRVDKTLFGSCLAWFAIRQFKLLTRGGGEDKIIAGREPTVQLLARWHQLLPRALRLA